MSHENLSVFILNPKLFKNFFDELLKSHPLDGTGKSAKCKACES
jgi:hypothetical protein